MDLPLTIQQIGLYTVVEFRTASLMDTTVLDDINEHLCRLVDEQDQRRIILDFEQVEYLSSRAIGLVLTLNKRLAALSRSKLVLCGVGPRLMELLKITALDRLLTVKRSQAEAMKV